jgi:hypothetical protein
VNQSLAVYYFKLSADQGFPLGQFNYGVCLWNGNGIPANPSLAAQYFKLAADQGNSAAQFNYGVALSEGRGIALNHALAAHYFKLAADQGVPQARAAAAREKASDVNLREGEYRRVIGLLSGEFGAINFAAAAAVARPGVAAELSAAARSGRRLVLEREFRGEMSAFSILSTGGFLLVRVMVPRLRPHWMLEMRCVTVWRLVAGDAAKFIGGEAVTFNFANLAVVDIMRVVLQSLFLSSSAFSGLNSVLERLPMAAVAPFESAFRGLLSYAMLLQAAVEVLAEGRAPLEAVVYWALSDECLVRQFSVAVGEVITWPGFIVGVGTMGEAVEAAGGPGSVALVFRVVLTPDAVAAEIGGFAERESRVMIAAESSFRVERVGEVRIGEVLVMEVSLSYAGSWSDRDLDLGFLSRKVPVFGLSETHQEVSDVP